MNGPRFTSSAIRAALFFGAVGALALYARRSTALDAPAIDVGELGPIDIDAGGPLDIRPVDRVPPPPPTVIESVTTFLGDAVTSVKRALLPRGMRNNNPGNIRTLPASRAWRGQVGDDRGYGVYDEMASGVRALAKQLLAYEKRGLVTVRAIIETWAPAVGRDPVTGKTYTQATPAYVTAVTRALQVKADDALDIKARLVELAAAIIKHENGAPFESYAAPELGRNWTRDELARWVRLP